MSLLSNSDKVQIKSHFSEEFSQKIIRNLNHYSNIWGLTHFSLIHSFSINCIFSCISNFYGKVILKIGDIKQENHTEVKTLHTYSNTKYCKLYKVDDTQSILLLEHIIPGTRLRLENDMDNRLNTFVDIFTGLYLEAEDTALFPSYLGWVKSIHSVINTQYKQSEIMPYINDAYILCHQLTIRYPKKFLLHGDLHHDNIILGTNQSYKIIDPKGVIGDPIFDISRFIMNEYDPILSQYENQAKIKYILKRFARALNYPEEQLAQCFFIETVMAYAWNIEDGKKSDITIVEIAKQILIDFKYLAY